MLRTSKIHEPANTDAKRAANAAQGDLLVAQALHHGVVFCVNHSVGSVEVAATRLALVILLADMNLAIFLEVLRSTFRTRLSDIHGHQQPPRALG